MSRTVEIVGPLSLDEILGRIEFDARRSLVEMDLFSYAASKGSAALAPAEPVRSAPARKSASAPVMKLVPPPPAAAPVKPESRFVDARHIDLEGEYAAMNKKFFDGKLGMYPMKWNKRKGYAAIVKYRKTRDPDNPMQVVSVEVSMHRNITHQAFLNSLVHEMIHVYWIEQGVEDNHGPSFKREMARINAQDKAFHITIAVDNDYEKEHGQSEYRPEEVWVMVYDRPRVTPGPHGLITTKGKIGSMAKELASKNMMRPGFNVDFYYHKTAWTVPYKKAINATGYYKWTPEQMDDLKKNAKLVASVDMADEDSIQRGFAKLGVR